MLLLYVRLRHRNHAASLPKSDVPCSSKKFVRQSQLNSVEQQRQVRSNYALERRFFL